MSAMVKYWISGIVMVVFVFGLTAGTRAAYFDDFESYNVGDVIQGKGDFIYWGNNTDPNSHAFVSNVVAFNSDKSLMLGGHDGAHYTDPVWQFADIATGVSPVSSGQWVQRQMVYVPASSIKAGGEYVDFNYMSSHGGDPPVPFDWGGGVLHFNLVDGKVEGPGVTGDVFIVPDQWIEVRMEVDFDTLPRATGNYYYDGAIISTYEWDDDPVQLAGIDYWAPAAAGPIYIDDVSLTPEPATMALLAVGSLALLRRRRK